jgi:regulator of sirC expression with transglutaminase-like and TPR domain
VRSYSPGELHALVILLGDDSPDTVSVARTALLEAEEVAVPFLEEAAASRDPQIRGRARLLLEDLRIRVLGRRLADYAGQDDAEMDLLEGALLLAEYAYPDLDWLAIRRFLDEASAAVRSRLGSHYTPADGLRELGHVLFDQYGFRGGKFSDPEESYLNRVIERRTGLPIALAVLYTLIGRRAGLPVSGVNLPFFFVARYETDDGPVFIDCYNRGRLLTRGDCAAIVTGGGGRFAEVQLRAEVPRHILTRMLTNLENVYRSMKAEKQTEAVIRFRGILLGES